MPVAAIPNEKRQGSSRLSFIVFKPKLLNESPGLRSQPVKVPLQAAEEEMPLEDNSGCHLFLCQCPLTVKETGVGKCPNGGVSVICARLGS